MPPSEAQFIDAMQLNATQIAAVLNLPPDRIGGTRGDSLTYNTVVQARCRSSSRCARGWCGWSRRSSSCCRATGSRFYTDALLKTDLQTRMEIYEVQRNIGMRTADEIRELEDLPPLPGGGRQRVHAAGSHGGNVPVDPRHPQVHGVQPGAGDRIAADRLQKLQANNPPLAAPDMDAGCGVAGRDARPGDQCAA